MQDSIHIIQNIKESSFINSWSIGESESFALWKIYLSQSKYGVALRSNVRDFIYSIKHNDFNIIPIAVKYYNQSKEGLSNMEPETISGSKNTFYQYENEFRALIIDQSLTGSGDNKVSQKFDSGVYVPVDLYMLFDSIYISPGAPEWFYEIVCDLRNNYRLPQQVIESQIKDKL
jgi:hypothetical protein